jgi:ARG and Rhodanese-Phosphatase-superfamily-associated Protein domain
VHETGAVSELAIENTAADAEVFVQAGDIVQGGDQDRTIARDLVLAAASGRLPLPSFCVEQGRWSPRGQPAPVFSGQEAADYDFAVSADGATGCSAPFMPAQFAFASNAVPTIELKRAIARADQDRVWSEVGHVQCMLAANVSPEVVDRSSPSSLELTLDTDAVRSATDAYVTALGGMFTARDDVVGCVFVVGGRLQSADVYGSRALLRSLWPKLLRAAATAALAAPQDETVSPPAEDAVRAFIAAPTGAALRETRGTVTETVGETGCAQVIESRAGDALLHRACLAK